MTRNQMIALGCGGAGCLGLLVVVIAAGMIWYFQRSQGTTTNRNSPYNFNVNANRNSNSNSNSNASDSDADTSSKPSSSMSDDDQHKLYHAATATKDTNTMIRVWKKLGLADSDGTPNEKYRQFAQDHIGWLFRNTAFMQEMTNEQKARDYVAAHVND